MAVRALVIAILAGCELTGPSVLSDYGSQVGANGKDRRGRHPGIDFAGALGDPVLAAMDGRVIDVSNSPDSGGVCVLLRHSIRDERYFTLYCHLARSLVQVGDTVARGANIGEVGASGKGAGGVVHLHFQLCTQPCTAPSEDGELQGTIDPAAYSTGCFDPRHAYARGTLELSYPVRC